MIDGILSNPAKYGIQSMEELARRTGEDPEWFEMCREWQIFSTDNIKRLCEVFGDEAASTALCLTALDENELSLVFAEEFIGRGFANVGEFIYAIDGCIGGGNDHEAVDSAGS
jgi:hypothetical protein